MAARELVGRPLVPFFDADDNVNAALAVDERSAERGPLDVDARVWNKALGYFEYPSEAPTPDSSAPEAKALLTPAMMLSPDPPASGSNARSSSTKKQRAKNAKQKTAATAEMGENGRGGKKSRGKGRTKKEELSASGKWAWSAFQSSPEPEELPLPPFLARTQLPAPPPPPPLPPNDPPAASYMASPPRSYSQVTQGIVPPFQPPLPPNPPPDDEPMSIELSMTQDLRRMLNIGG